MVKQNKLSNKQVNDIANKVIKDLNKDLNLTQEEKDPGTQEKEDNIDLSKMTEQEKQKYYMKKFGIEFEVGAPVPNTDEERYIDDNEIYIQDLSEDKKKDEKDEKDNINEEQY